MKNSPIFKRKRRSYHTGLIAVSFIITWGLCMYEAVTAGFSHINYLHGIILVWTLVALMQRSKILELQELIDIYKPQSGKNHG